VDRWQTRDGATARSFGETLETMMSARTHDIRDGERDSQAQSSTSGDAATGHDYLVFPASGRTFRAPHAGESFGACTSRSWAPSMAVTLISGARHSLSRPARAGPRLPWIAIVG
jgi:hypothetical protein